MVPRRPHGTTMSLRAQAYQIDTLTEDEKDRAAMSLIYISLDITIRSLSRAGDTKSGATVMSLQSTSQKLQPFCQCLALLSLVIAAAKSGSIPASDVCRGNLPRSGTRFTTAFAGAAQLWSNSYHGDTCSRSLILVQHPRNASCLLLYSFATIVLPYCSALCTVTFKANKPEQRHNQLRVQGSSSGSFSHPSQLWLASSKNLRLTAA